MRAGWKGKRAEGETGVTAGHVAELDSRAELIQALIPLGLEAANELLQQEVTALAGRRYQRHGGQPATRAAACQGMIG